MKARIKAAMTATAMLGAMFGFGALISHYPEATTRIMGVLAVLMIWGVLYLAARMMQKMR